MAGIRNGDLTLCVDVRTQFVHDHFPALIPVFLREVSDVVAFILFQRVLIVKVSHGHEKIIIIADFLLPFRIFQQELEKHLPGFIDDSPETDAHTTLIHIHFCDMMQCFLQGHATGLGSVLFKYFLVFHVSLYLLNVSHYGGNICFLPRNV